MFGARAFLTAPAADAESRIGQPAGANTRGAATKLLPLQDLSDLSRTRDPRALQTRLVTVSDALRDETLRADLAEAALKQAQTQIQKLEMALRIKSSATESSKNELLYSGEHTRVLAAELGVLRIDSETLQLALVRSEAELAAALEQVATRDRDNRRLLLLTEEQSRRLSELQAALEAERGLARGLQDRIAASAEAAALAEALAREQTEAWAAERARLLADLAALESDKAAGEDLMQRMRETLWEKDDSLRAAERDLRDARRAKGAADRRLETASTELARRDDRLVEAQRQRDELAAGADSLARALGVKEAALERLTGERAATAAELDRLSDRHAALLRDFERAVRAHDEELARERSERAMAQHALEIARASRVALQKRHDAARLPTIPWREACPDASAASPDPVAEHGGNVHTLYGVN